MSDRAQYPQVQTAASVPGDSEWLEIDWSEHRRWVTVAGRRVNCVEFGDGPAVLLVHGLGGNWQNWLENIPALASGHRVIAADLPGFGESELPDAPITIDFYARWVAQLADTLSVQRCALIGNSMGGQIAAEVALQRPDLVQRLVLVDAAGITAEDFNKPNTIRLLKRADRLVAFWSKQVVARGRGLTRRRRARRRLMVMWVRHPERLSGPLVAELARGSGKPGFADALTALTTHPLRSRLHQIGQPTLIVWGADDRMTPLRDAHALHAAIAGSRLVIYPDTGHLSMVERPVEFNALVEEFLEG